MSARFGPAGNSDSFSRVHRSSLAAPGWFAGRGLDCYEYQCGKGVHVGEDTARKVGENAVEAGISLSLHAPYFINLANPDPEALKKTVGYITGACLAASWMGAERVVIHSGALMKRSRQEALETARASLREVIAACDGAGFGHIALCPETMGKINQLGDLDEVLELCTLDERLIPCIDFGHLYARSLGADDGQKAFVRMLDRVEEVLGTERASRFPRIEALSQGPHLKMGRRVCAEQAFLRSKNLGGGGIDFRRAVKKRVPIRWPIEWEKARGRRRRMHWR